jgi:hypothetical protein
MNKTAAPEVGRLSIMARTHRQISQSLCVLCGRPGLTARTNTGLYDGDLHLGDLCNVCLRSGKRGAAVRTRAHSAELEHWAEQHRARPQTAQTDQSYQWLDRDASFLDGLAARLEHMTEWMPRPG